MIKNRRKKHKLTKVCLYYSNVADFTRWSGLATPFNEYKMNVVKNIQVLRRQGDTVLPVVFDEDEYLEFLAQERIQPQNQNEHTAAMRKWALATASDGRKISQRQARQEAKSRAIEHEPLANSPGRVMGITPFILDCPVYLLESDDVGLLLSVHDNLLLWTDAPAALSFLADCFGKLDYADKLNLVIIADDRELIELLKNMPPRVKEVILDMAAPDQKILRMAYVADLLKMLNGRVAG
ncbi:MAG: hypothetical protein ACLP9L_21785 [Thermoguttaceae bacterium]